MTTLWDRVSPDTMNTYLALGYNTRSREKVENVLCGSHRWRWIHGCNFAHVVARTQVGINEVTNTQIDRESLYLPNCLPEQDVT